MPGWKVSVEEKTREKRWMDGLMDGERIKAQGLLDFPDERVAFANIGICFGIMAWTMDCGWGVVKSSVKRFS